MSFVLPGVVRIPARNSFQEGAMLEPVNTVLKAVRRLHVIKGDTVLVVGQGPIGLMFTRLLALRGVRVVATDLMPRKLKLAADFGAFRSVLGDVTASAAQLVRINKAAGFDAAVVAVPSDAVVHSAQRLVRGGGQVLLFAHTRRGVESPLDLASICVDEKDLIGSYSSDITLQDQVARIVFSRRLDVRKLITHTFALDQTAAAVSLAASPQPDSLKVVVGGAALAEESSGRQPL
jgi:L-iditol 2-dehydrogenase